MSGGRAASRNAISLANLPRDSASSRSLFPHGGGGGRRLSFMAPLFFQASSRKSSFLSGFTGHLWGGIMKTDSICPGMGSCLQGARFPPARVFPASRETLPSRPFPPLLPLNLGLHCWPPLERPPPPRRHRPRGTGEAPSSKDCAAHPGNCRPAEGEGVPAAHPAPSPGNPRENSRFPWISRKFWPMPEAQAVSPLGTALHGAGFPPARFSRLQGYPPFQPRPSPFLN